MTNFYSANALVCLATTLACTATGVRAQAEQSTQSPQPLWEAGAFVGTVNTPAYPASSDRTGRVLALPYLIYRGDVLRVDRGNIGARLVHSDDFEINVGFAASLPANSQDVAVRNGMSDLGTLLEFGPRVRGTVARLSPGSRIRFDLPVRTVVEVNNGIRSQGFATEPELTYEVRDAYDGWRLSTGASLVIGDTRLHNYFYGVPVASATTQRPAYDAQAGLLATRLSVSTTKSITPDLRVFAFMRYENYANAANRASPLFTQNSGTAAGLGLTWTFARSSERASD